MKIQSTQIELQYISNTKMTGNRTENVNHILYSHNFYIFINKLNKIKDAK